MTKIDNKCLLAGDKFIPKFHLRKQGVTYSACGPFTKYCERIQNFKEIGNLKHIYKNELDKACFAHDAAYSDSKDLAKRTISDKIMKDRAYKIAINPRYDGYQRGLASMVFKVLDKKKGSGAIATSKAGASANEELAQ